APPTPPQQWRPGSRPAPRPRRPGSRPGGRAHHGRQPRHGGTHGRRPDKTRMITMPRHDEDASPPTVSGPAAGLVTPASPDGYSPEPGSVPGMARMKGLTPTTMTTAALPAGFVRLIVGYD